jgi:hypothetical protein
MGRARDLANILSSSGNVALDSELGLSLITPNSVATTGGSATSTISSTGTVSFTSASAISLNGVFNSTYTTYKINIRVTGTSPQAFVMRMRASGTDATASTYYWAGQYQAPNTTSEGGENGNGVSSGQIGGVSGEPGFIGMELNSPFAAAKTQYTAFGFDDSYKRIYAGVHATATSYDGFTIFPNSGTITGTVLVYGYRN